MKGDPNAHKPRKRNRTGLAYEVGAIAREVGAEVVEGDLRYPSVTGNWATWIWVNTWTATETND